MEVRIKNFRGEGAKEAKMAIFRYFKGYPRQYWHYQHGLDESTGTAWYKGTYLAEAWTGRKHDRPQFPLPAYRFVAGIKPVELSDFIIAVMKRIQGIK